MSNRPRRPDEVYDDQGRQRFHGAFTGGFSAGYYNTVGSKEGWVPKAGFVSSNKRGSKRNENLIPTQSIHDFMDDEDAFDAKISSEYVHSDGRNQDRLVNLMKVDDQIGLKLLRMASRARHKAKASRKIEMEDWEESTVTESQPLHIPLQSNLKCRGLGFEPDEAFRKAKEAKLQSFFQPDDTYDIYDNYGDHKSLRSQYSNEIIDHNHTLQEEAENDTEQNDFLIGLDAYTKVDDNFQNSDVLSGFQLGSEETEFIKRFPGPDVPFDFNPSSKKFPIDLTKEEIELERSYEFKPKLKRPIKVDEKPVVDSSKQKTIQFEKVALEMRNRFTSASSESSKIESKKVSFTPKRETFMFIPCRLLCKRFNVPFTSHSKNVPADVKLSQSQKFNSFDGTVAQIVEKENLKKIDDNKEDIEDEPIKRPPLDLFKSIFDADSETSESDAEANNEDSNGQQHKIHTDVSKQENTKQEKLDEHFFSGKRSSIRHHSVSSSSQSSVEEKKHSKKDYKRSRKRKHKDKSDSRKRRKSRKDKKDYKRRKSSKDERRR